MIEYNYCGKMGHQEYECYAKKGLPNQQNSGQKNFKLGILKYNGKGNEYHGQNLHHQRNESKYWTTQNNY